MSIQKMFITDLDGTLFRHDQTVSTLDKEALLFLKNEDIIRVAATGRSVFSLLRSLKEPLPVDYLIFSTGAGIAKYPNPFQNILKSSHLDENQTEHAAAFLDSLKLDYMIQNPIPDNHIFKYRYHSNNNSDFDVRMQFYKQFCSPLDGNLKLPSSQLLVIAPDQQGGDILEHINEKLKGYSVIKATSPFDHKTTWIEILPKNTSKSIAAQWLADRLGTDRHHTVAVGNDYNDEDMLSWANEGYVVSNAPEALKAKFKTVQSNENNGVCAAVKTAFKTDLRGKVPQPG